MKQNEFESAVRELRQRQRRFFRCRKDDPDRDMATALMREQEKVVEAEIKRVMAVRPKGKQAQNEREEFFLKTAHMMKKQRDWVMHGGGWGTMYSDEARQSEKEVDAMLTEWDEQRKQEKRRKQEEEAKKQTSLF